MTKERYVVIDHENRSVFQLAVDEYLAEGYIPVGGVAVGIIPSGNRAVYTVRYAQALYWPLQETETEIETKSKPSMMPFSQESEHAKSNS